VKKKGNAQHRLERTSQIYRKGRRNKGGRDGRGERGRELITDLEWEGRRDDKNKEAFQSQCTYQSASGLPIWINRCVSS